MVNLRWILHGSEKRKYLIKNKSGSADLSKGKCNWSQINPI